MYLGTVLRREEGGRGHARACWRVRFDGGCRGDAVWDADQLAAGLSLHEAREGPASSRWDGDEGEGGLWGEEDGWGAGGGSGGAAEASDADDDEEGEDGSEGGEADEYVRSRAPVAKFVNDVRAPPVAPRYPFSQLPSLASHRRPRVVWCGVVACRRTC